MYRMVSGGRFLGVLALAAIPGLPLGPRLAAQGAPPDTSIISKVVRLESFRFGSDPACGVGFFIGGPGLILTTYRTIRGAERLRIALADGRQLGDVAVASYSVSRDVAVLHAPDLAVDSIVEGGTVNPGQSVWAWGYRDGGGSTGFRLSVAARPEAPGDSILLTGSLPLCSSGGPLISERGYVVGIIAGSDYAIPISEARPAIAQARSYVSSGNLMSAQEVAQREHHLFGSAVLSSDQPDTRARVAPLETWHWPGTAREADLPFTFLGPMGRYEVELIAAGVPSSRTTFELRPGVGIQVKLFPGVAAAGGGGSSKLPWVLSVLGAAGAGTAVAVLAGGATGETSPPQGGTIVVSVPKVPVG